MSKLIALTILVVSVTLVYAGCNQNPTTTNSNGNQNSASSSQATAAEDMEVTILFSGLMVLNKKSNGDFEMGILADEDVKKDHMFCVRQASASKVICRDGDMDKMGVAWSFTLDSPTQTSVELLGGDSPRPQRRPDDEKGQYDFNWIVNFDGPGFHDKPLEVEPGHLNPIIQLPKGQLFTRHKSYDFVRTKGETPENGAYGFVAETTGLRLTLRPGQELFLKDADGKKILSVPYAPPHAWGPNSEIISFTNVRPVLSEHSDFHMYYKLFPDLKKSEYYDFYENKEHPCPGKTEPCEPHNMVPYDERAAEKAAFMTCCRIDCTKIYLARSGSALR